MTRTFGEFYGGSRSLDGALISTPFELQWPVKNWNFSGTIASGQKVQLPNPTQVPGIVTGLIFVVANLGAGNSITIVDADDTTLGTVAVNQVAFCTLFSTTATPGDWEVSNLGTNSGPAASFNYLANLGGASAATEHDLEYYNGFNDTWTVGTSSPVDLRDGGNFTSGGGLYAFEGGGSFFQRFVFSTYSSRNVASISFSDNAANTAGKGQIQSGNMPWGNSPSYVPACSEYNEVADTWALLASDGATLGEGSFGTAFVEYTPTNKCYGASVGNASSGWDVTDAWIEWSRDTDTWAVRTHDPNSTDPQGSIHNPAHGSMDRINRLQLVDGGLGQSGTVGSTDAGDANRYYDPATDSWTNKLDFGNGTNTRGSVRFDNLAQLLVFGGFLTTPSGNSDTADSWNTTVDTWTSRATLSVERPGSHARGSPLPSV